MLLTRYVKASCPQQAIDEYTPDAWHDILGDLDVTACRAAVVAIARRQAFIAPADIVAEVLRARRRERERQRNDAVLGPLRTRREGLTDPRPLRSTIRELVAAQWPGKRELTAGDPP